MATYSKGILSGSTDGRGIKVVATDPTAGTTIHTAVASATDIDLITIFAYNSDTATRILTLEWGGSSDPDDRIIMSIPNQSGLVLVTADQPLRNNLVLKASGDVASKLVLYGYVNQIRA